MSYQDHLATLEKRFARFSTVYQKNREDDDREEEFKHRLFEIMRGAVGIVDDAQKANAADLPGVAEKAEGLLYKCVLLAYDVTGGEISLFETLESFAHTDERPLVKHGDAMEDQFSNKVHKLLPLVMKMMQGRISDPSKASEIANIFRPAVPWKDVVRLHPLSTRCARFMTQIPESCPPGDKPKALSVFQARAEVIHCDSYFPSQMISSPSGKCILTLGRGGWKERTPLVVAVYPEKSESVEILPDHHLRLDLADVAYHGAVDDESGLLFAGDGHRIKSYSWYDRSADAYREELHPTHTMDSKGFDSVIGMLPNGRLARAGRGKIAVWNLNELPTHDTSKKGIIGKSIAKRDEDLNTWRDDPENIERSSGSLPSATINLADTRLEILTWHPHPTAPGTMLVSAESRMVDPQYYCRALDIEHEGKCVTRYLGHAGKINNFSTSKGDSNLFVTACTGGFARLYDVRTPLPVITIQTGIDMRNCSAATLCHPDGIPYIFASEEEMECITLWDVRAKAPVYDLATGNNSVSGMSWNDERNELFAATWCRFVDRNGCHFDYEPAKIPIEKDDDDEEDGGAAKSEGDDDDWEDEDEDHDEEDEEEEYQDTDQCWPANAYHNETYFGHIFDSGDHRIYRYAFRSEPDPEIVPEDGGATAGDDGWF